MNSADLKTDPAIALIERGDYTSAEKHLKLRLTSRANAWEHGLLGTVYLLLGRPKKARKQLERAHALAPQEPEWTEKLQKVTAALESKSYVRFSKVLPFDRNELLAAPRPPRLPEPPRLSSPGWRDRLRAAAGRVVGMFVTRLEKLFQAWERFHGAADRHRGIWTDWYRKNLFHALLSLSAMRERLNSYNLVNTYPDGVLTGFQAPGQAIPPGVIHFRTVDGTWNNLSNPKEGAAGVRFSRNVDLRFAWPETGEKLLTPNPAEISQVLLARGEKMKEVPFLNLLAAAWIQFILHDWIGHRMDRRFGVLEVPLPEDHPARRKYYQSKMFVGRTAPDPTRMPEDEGTPPTFINQETAWWDGSQIYGSNHETASQLRTFKDGKLRLNESGLLPLDKKGLEQAGITRAWWVGLSMLHTLFVREHNAICDMLHARYPAWSDAQRYNVARLINAALMAKIHTLEWTPAILPNPTLRLCMNSNWYGLAEAVFKKPQERRTLPPLKIAHPVVGGLVGNALSNSGVPYALSEEFVEVYRMHELLPDALEFRRIHDPHALERVPLEEVTQAAVPRLHARMSMADLFFSFGKMHPGALVLNNYPRTMRELSIPGNPVYDLAAVDILRARERGIPRYNEFRRQLGLEPIRTFEDLTDDPEQLAALKRVYRDVEEIDLLIGNRAEAHRPEHFGFGETLFQIFILNASRRLSADRFYTENFNAETYTPEGLSWIDENDMKTVLLRHFPELSRTGLANVSNAFEPWDNEQPEALSRPPLLAVVPKEGGGAQDLRTGRTHVLARARFFLYRCTVGFCVWIGFRQRTHPLEPPQEGTVRFRPYAQAFPDMPLPGIYDAETFPASDRAKERLRRIKLQKTVLTWLQRRVLPAYTPPVPRSPERFLDAVYPYFFRRAWPTPPRVPPDLKSEGDGKEPDILALLAVRGPFGSYLRRTTADEVSAGEASAEDYVVDLSWMLEYGTFEGLVRPGGKAVLSAQDGRLVTSALHYPGSSGNGGDSRQAWRTRDALLAAMNEDLTTFRHNLSAHLAMLTPFALATTNRLGTKHPVRRLLHHCFHTVLIGNREIGEFQLPGPEGFSATIFSHDHRVLARMATDYLRRFDFWDFEPRTQFSRRGTLDTPFTYPYRDNVLQLWRVTHAYADEYLRLYYPGDVVTPDPELDGWLAELDRLVPNGVRRPAEGLTREWLTCLCATVIHVSTVEHDLLNNAVWDYSTPSWIVPTAVPSSGELMDQRRAFDLIATLIGTWKPYNMLLSEEIAALALDPRARRVTERWIERLREIQEGMPIPRHSDLVYPENLDVSLSN